MPEMPTARDRLITEFDALMATPEMRAATPAPARAGSPRPRRDNSLLRGIGTFLGYIPEGGTRGDRVELIADLARGLLGEAPIKQVEADYNQRMAEEMLRRAIATGDPNEIARLSPEMALQLKRYGTFDEDREYERRLRQSGMDDAARKRMLEQQEYEQAREENRVISASRAVSAANQLSGGDPEAFAQIIGRFAEEQPNLFSATEMEISAQPNGGAALEKYFAQIRAGGAGSAPKLQAVDHPELGPIMYNPATAEYQFDENGNPIRPYGAQQRVEYGPGLYGGFDPVTGQYVGPGGTSMMSPGVAAIPAGAPVMPGEAPEDEMMGFESGEMPAPTSPQLMEKTPRSLVEQVAEAEKIVAQQRQFGTQSANEVVKLYNEIGTISQNAAPIIARIEDIERMDDADLDLITGAPSYDKAQRGGFGALVNPLTGVPITLPETRAARVAGAYAGLLGDLRMLGFEAVKGAGQVTEAESKFAADAIASLNSGSWASTEDLLREVDQVRRIILLSLQTRRARMRAFQDGNLELAYDTSDDAIKMLREMYAETEMPRTSGPSRLPPRRKIGADARAERQENERRRAENPLAYDDPEKERRFQEWLAGRGQ